MKRWLKRIAWLFALLLLAAAATAVWVLQTESGARFAFDRARAALANAISVEQLHGELTGPLELHGLRYHDAAAGIDVHVDKVRIEYALSGLWSKSLKVQSLDADGVSVTLTTVPAGPAVPAPQLASLLTPPLDLLLDRAHIGRIAVSKDGKMLVALDRLELAGAWTRGALSISSLTAQAPEGTIELAGSVTSYSDLRSAAKATFDWRVGGRRFAGALESGNDGKSARIGLKLQEPLIADLDAHLDPRVAAVPWTAELHVPRFDPRAFINGDSLKTVALDVKGSGDRARGGLSAQIALNDHHVTLDPLQFALSAQTLTLESVRLRSSEAAGQLNAEGTVQLDASPVAADITVAWEDVEIPADVAGRSITTHGSLKASGNADKFTTTGTLALDSAGERADAQFDFDTTPQSITVRQLELKQPGGGLRASGDITLRPTLAWHVTAQAHALDPAAFVPDWPGAIDFDLSTNGTMENGGPAGQITLTRLGGTLRRHPLAGSADLRLKPPLALEGSLELKSGGSSIALQGRGARSHADLTVANLSDWVPSASGSLHGRADVDGTWPHLDVRGDLDATAFTAGDLTVAALKVHVEARNSGTDGGAITTEAHSLAVAGYTFDSLKIHVNGTRDQHALTVEARGPQIEGDLGIDGALRGETWSGTLETLALTPKIGEQTQWPLAHPAELAYAKGDFRLGETCLAAQASKLCVAAMQSAGSTEARFSIEHLALAAIARLAKPDESAQLEGEIQGRGELKRTPDGTLSGHASITSASGSVADAGPASSPLFGYTGLDINATFAAAQSTVALRANFTDGGRLDGHIELGAPATNGMPISGTIAGDIRNLGAVDLFSAQTSATKGTLDATITLSGTTAAPVIAGDLVLADFATELPFIGLKLHDGRATLHSGGGRNFRLDASVASADGVLTITGDGGAEAGTPVTIRISGDSFLAADIPGAKVHISPDLTLTRAEKQLMLTGTVTIPKADIDLAKLPGGGMTKASPDVVIVDAESSPAPESLPYSADIQVKIGAGEKLAMDLRQGQEVHLVGFGLNGYLSGQIGVQERPGRTTTARGQVIVNGTYKAYGQDLKIEQGRLLFAGTPLDNPGLSVRATRSFTNPDVTVGLQVRGTARAPVLSTFSEPAMGQSDALSYLVAGRPLSQLKSGEGDAVGSAARALGTASGDLIAKNIGSRMGLDDVGVTDSTAIGGAALTIGKYLSPRLYMSYGVGLFTPGEVVTLRYRLTRLLNIEIENGTLSSRAGINYKIEK
jgi:translocation and assembly module TamB